MKARRALTLAGIALLAVSGTASADQATAKKHFDEGRDLLKEGKLEAACQSFVDSHREHQSVGAMLNLGECRERQGKITSARAAFDEAARVAERENDSERASYAKKRGRSLKTRLSYIQLDLSSDVVDLPGFEVRIGDDKVAARDIGKAIAVDTGTHDVVATANGYKKFTFEAVVEGERARVKVTIELKKKTSAADDSDTPSDDNLAPTTKDTSAGMTSRRKTAYVMFAVAAVGAGAGAYFGLSASSKWNDAKQCLETPAPCTAEDADLADTARTHGHISTGAFALAAVGAGVGLWLFLTDDTKTERAVSIGPGSVTYFATF